MNKKFWYPKIKPFLIPNEDLNKFGEDSYSVQDKLEIVFWFEGGLKVGGSKDSMALNLKDPDLMVLSTGLEPIRIFRVPYERLIGFELVRGKGSKEEFIRFFRN